MDRQTLVEELMQAGRENSTATVLFHNAIADRVGLNATESKTLDLLVRFGPQSAGQIAEHTALATPSVTSLIDGLERKGFVRRVRHPQDRRKVMIEPVEEALHGLAGHFAGFAEHMAGLAEGYSDEQLVLVTEFTRRVNDYLRRATDQLRLQGRISRVEDTNEKDPR